MTNQKKQKTVAELFAELDSIVNEFEQDKVDLDNAVKKFKQAVEVAKQLKKQLTELESEIEEIDLEELQDN